MTDYLEKAEFTSMYNLQFRSKRRSDHQSELDTERQDLITKRIRLPS